MDLSELQDQHIYICQTADELHYIVLLDGLCVIIHAINICYKCNTHDWHIGGEMLSEIIWGISSPLIPSRMSNLCLLSWMNDLVAESA